MLQMNQPINTSFNTPIDSVPSWEGLTSNKFSYTRKRHFSPQDAMQTIIDEMSFQGQKRHFSPNYIVETKEKPLFRLFPHIQNRETNVNLPSIKNRNEFFPIPKEYGHKQRRHLYQDGSQEWHYVPSIKTFPSHMRKDVREIDLESLNKKSLDAFGENQSLLNATKTSKTLGDKVYKTPENSQKLIHEKGSVLTNTNIFKDTRNQYDRSPDLSFRQQNAISWVEKVKREERAEEVKAVRELAQWEQSNLKQQKLGRESETNKPELSRRTRDQKLFKNFA